MCVRLSAACAFLSDSDLPITTVAESSGFQNLAHFNRRFRRHTGLTPTKYRAAGRTAEGLPAVYFASSRFTVE